MRGSSCLVVMLVALAPRALAQALPDLGGAGDVSLSPQMERRIGESIVRDIRLREPAYVDDPELAEYLGNLGARLAQQAGARFDFEFFVMRDHSINAFALPGGFVGVHTGLLTAADTESELASVLAHGTSPVTQRHIARMLGQQQQLQMPMLAALAAAILLGRARPDLAVGAALGAQAAGVQASLSYSRDFEREADRIGIQRLDDAGFDAHAMPTFFERMQRANRISEDSTMPGYFRSHPVTSEGIAEVQTKPAPSQYRPHPDSAAFRFFPAQRAPQH